MCAQNQNKIGHVNFAGLPAIKQLRYCVKCGLIRGWRKIIKWSICAQNVSA